MVLVGGFGKDIEYILHVTNCGLSSGQKGWDVYVDVNEF
jgi:hypothetical protein